MESETTHLLFTISLIALGVFYFGCGVYVLSMVGIVRDGFRVWFTLSGAGIITIGLSYILEALHVASTLFFGPWIRRPIVFFLVLMLLALIRGVLPCILKEKVSSLPYVGKTEQHEETKGG